MNRTIRFSTLVRDFGPIEHALTVSEKKWQAAVKDGRFATVYHGESDWCTPVVAVVRHHGCCNTICKITFAKPLPDNIKEIIGMRDSDAAFAVCNRQHA